MGSIAMDHSGNIALGYSVSSARSSARDRLTGRLAGDPMGTMQAETQMIAGGGSQPSRPQPLGRLLHHERRPGRRLHLLVHDEYLKSNGTFNWSTWIAFVQVFGLRNRAPAPPAAPTGLLASAASAGQINLDLVRQLRRRGRVHESNAALAVAAPISPRSDRSSPTTIGLPGRVRALPQAPPTRIASAPIRAPSTRPYTAPAEATTQAATISPPACAVATDGHSGGEPGKSTSPGRTTRATRTGLRSNAAPAAAARTLSAIASVGRRTSRRTRMRRAFPQAPCTAYRVRAYKASVVVRLFSPSAEATTPPAVVAPNPPQNLVATVPQAKKQISLTWSAARRARPATTSTAASPER